MTGDYLTTTNDVKSYTPGTGQMSFNPMQHLTFSDSELNKRSFGYYSSINGIVNGTPTTLTNVAASIQGIIKNGDDAVDLNSGVVSPAPTYNGRIVVPIKESVLSKYQSLPATPRRQVIYNDLNLHQRQIVEIVEGSIIISLNSDFYGCTSHGTQSVLAQINTNSYYPSFPITIPSIPGYFFEGYYTQQNGQGVQIINQYGELNNSVSGYTDSNGAWKYNSNLTLFAKFTQYHLTIRLLYEPISNNAPFPCYPVSSEHIDTITVDYNNNNYSQDPINYNQYRNNTPAFIFKGFYTELAGEGTRIIDEYGYILENVDGYTKNENWIYKSNGIPSGIDLYAYWEDTAGYIKYVAWELNNYGAYDYISINFGESIYNTNFGTDSNPVYLCAERLITGTIYDNTYSQYSLMRFNGDPIKIPSSIFQGRKELRVIELPESVITIEDNAFKNCYGTNSGVYYGLNTVITPGVQFIGQHAFENCAALSKVIITRPMASSLYYRDLIIGYRAFYKAFFKQGAQYSNQSTFSYNGTVSQISQDAFRESGIAIMDIPISGVGYNMFIHESAFQDCTYLQGLDIIRIATYIGKRAFKGCISLQSIVIGNICPEYEGFASCSKLTSITFIGNKNDVGKMTDGTTYIVGYSGSGTVNPNWKSNKVFRSCNKLNDITCSSDGYLIKKSPEEHANKDRYIINGLI